MPQNEKHRKANENLIFNKPDYFQSNLLFLFTNVVINYGKTGK